MATVAAAIEPDGDAGEEAARFARVAHGVVAAAVRTHRDVLVGRRSVAQAAAETVWPFVCGTGADGFISHQCTPSFS